MADAFGIVCGAVGIASIFSTCVECFNYVQAGRHFGKDLQTEILVLRLLQLRLSRWGDAVHIYDDPKLGNPNSSDADVSLAKDALYQILVLMADSENMSRKYRPEAVGGQDFTGPPTADPSAANLQNLDNKMRTLAQRRQKRASLVRLATWALYDKEQYSALSEKIAKLLDHLENLFRATEVEKRLIDDEIVQVTSGLRSDGADAELLEVLHALTVKFDAAMETQLAKAMATDKANSINIGTIDTDGNMKLVYGDFIGKAWKGQASLPTGNTETNIGTIKGSQESRMQIGNIYGEEYTFWD